MIYSLSNPAGEIKEKESTRLALHHAGRKMTGTKRKINEGKVRRIHKMV